MRLIIRCERFAQVVVNGLRPSEALRATNQPCTKQELSRQIEKVKKVKLEDVQKELAKAKAVPPAPVEESTPESNISDVTFLVASTAAEHHWFE